LQRAAPLHHPLFPQRLQFFVECRRGAGKIVGQIVPAKEAQIGGRFFTGLCHGVSFLSKICTEPITASAPFQTRTVFPQMLYTALFPFLKSILNI
jgi:hypothetical protein